MNLFKTALLATVCVVAASTPSLAAKGTGNWGGSYAGLSAGYIQDSSDLTDVNNNYVGNDTDFPSSSASSLEFGAQAGYNWQDGRTVYGLEADAFGAYGETKLGNETGADPDQVVGQTIDSTSSIRGRLGVTMDNDYLIYGTGGVAFLQTTSDHWDDNNYDGADRFYTGWTAGVGAERKINSTYSAKIEGRYSEFSSQIWRDGSDEAFSVDPKIFAISAGVNYHF